MHLSILLAAVFAVAAPARAQVPTGDDQIATVYASSVAVTTNPAVALPAAPKGTKTILVNEGPSDMRIGGSTSTVSQTVGLLLKANGLPMAIDDGRAYFTGILVAVSTGGPAASKLSILQGNAP